MISLYRYRLKMHMPLTPEKETHREGVILRYTGRGNDIAGEAAPLPGFSEESLDQVVNHLLAERRNLEQLLESVARGAEVSRFLEQRAWPASLQFAVSSLALHLLSKGSPGSGSLPSAGLSVPDTASPGASGLSDAFVSETPGTLQGLPDSSWATGGRIRVNATIGRGDGEHIRTEIGRLYRLGFRTIKIKCAYPRKNETGSRESIHPEELSTLLQDLSPDYPDLVFRIDANRSWPESQAEGILQFFAGLPVEYVEEPFAFTSLLRFGKLKKHSPLPLALDESIRSLRQLRHIVGRKRADVVILKPTLLGDIFKIIETFSSGKTHPIQRVCTTTLESGVGRRAVIKVASMIGSGQFAQGLDTGRFMEEDLYREPRGNGWLDSRGLDWCLPWALCRKEQLSKMDME